ncbi:unnamed protein product [Lasius platythorax]
MELKCEGLLQEQRDLYGRISRVVENLRKLGQANITQGAVQSRLTLLDKYWSRFEEQHTILRTEHKDALKQQDYTKSDFVSKVEEAYQDQKSTLLDLAARLSKQS